MSAVLFSLSLLGCATETTIQGSVAQSSFQEVNRSPSATADDLERLEERIRHVNMFDYRTAVMRSKFTPSASAKAVEDANQELLRVLDQTSASVKSLAAAARPGSTWRASISMREAQDLYRWLENHKVAGSSQILKYDPDVQIGFCFGRAAAVHLQALRQPTRLFPNSVRKIWVIGPMEGGWGHHVATLVHINDGEHLGFYAVDPVTYGVVSARNWMETVTREYKLNEPLMFFVTDPSRFGPFPGKYTKMDLFGPERGDKNVDAYRGYFDDLMKKFHIDTDKNLNAAKKTMAQELNIVHSMATEQLPEGLQVEKE